MRNTLARMFAVALIGSALYMGSVVPYDNSPTITPPWIESHIYAPVKKSARKVVKASERPTQSMLCLAQVLFFEGRFEPTNGLEAIASTVFNRQQQSSSSICAVVYKPAQFSWTSDLAKWTVTPPQEFFTLAKSLMANRDILIEAYPVTHFHRVDVHPKWANQLTYVGTFGQHRFYSSKL